MKNISKNLSRVRRVKQKNWHGSDGSQEKSHGSAGSRVLRVGSGRVREVFKRPRVGSGRVKNPYLVTGHGSRVDPGRRLTRSIPTLWHSVKSQEFFCHMSLLWLYLLFRFNNLFDIITNKVIRPNFCHNFRLISKNTCGRKVLNIHTVYQ